MKLPGGDKAYIDPRKLAGYALKPDHVEGGPKARVFAAALGLTAADAPILAEALLRAAATEEATFVGSSSDGDLFRIDFSLSHRSRTAVVRSGWVKPADGRPTRLTTVFVLKVTS